MSNISKRLKLNRPQLLLPAVKSIPTKCKRTVEQCEPIPNFQASVLLALVENLGHVKFLPHLEKIILSEEIPLEIRSKAIMACKPLIKIAPKIVRMRLIRMFRNLKLSAELRMIAFSILMENPTVEVVHLCARHVYREPSVHVRGFVYDVLVAIRRTQYPYSKEIVNAVRVCLNLYSKRVPLIPSRLSTLSKHLLVNLYAKNWKVGALWHLDSVSTGKSVMPSLIYTRLKMDFMGRQLTLAEAQLRVEGLQEVLIRIINKLQSTSSWDSIINPIRKIRSLSNVVEEIQRIEQQLRIALQPAKRLRLFLQLKVFDKLAMLQHAKLDTDFSLFNIIFQGMYKKAAKWESDLRDGKQWTFLKPVMPVEVICQVPSLIGVPMTMNLTSIVVPHVVNKIKAVVEPRLFTATGMLNKNITSVMLESNNNIQAVTEVRGGLYFRIPYAEVGARMRTIMKVETNVRAKVRFDWKTKEYKTEIFTPQKMNEVVSIQNQIYHYIKPDVPRSGKVPRNLKIRKIPVEIDQLGQVLVINSKKRCAKKEHCRYEEWILKTLDGKFVTVRGGKVTLDSKPQLIRVLFHGQHRRIVSFFVPGEGHVTATPFHPCLKVKNPETNKAGKLFVIDYVRPSSVIRLRTLVRFHPHAIRGWGFPTKRELREMLDVQRVFMREMVRLDNEHLIDEEELKPEVQKMRLAYLNFRSSHGLCLSPAKQKALKIKVIRKVTIENVLSQESMTHGACYGAKFGLKVCLRGFVPGPKVIRHPALPLLLPQPKLLLAPFEARLRVEPAEAGAPEKFEIVCKEIQNTAKAQKYEITAIMKPNLKGAKIHYTWNRQTNKAILKVIPTSTELFEFKRLCIETALLPDNYTMKVSLHPECSVEHLKVQLVAAKQLPRHWLTLNLRYTTRALPPSLLQTFEFISKHLILPALRQTATTYYPRYDVWQKRKAAEVNLFLKSQETVTLRVKTPQSVFLWTDIRVPTSIRTFPKGSKHLPLYLKLRYLFQARCFHQRSTFTTFDKVNYKHNLRGKCAHVLVHKHGNHQNMLSILLKRTTMKQKFRLLRTLVIYANNKKIEIIPTNFVAKPKCLINGQESEFSEVQVIRDAKNSPLLYLVWEYEIKTFVFFHARLGIAAFLRLGHEVTVVLSDLHSGKVGGLCGNYDGERFNEFTTPRGLIIHDVTRPRLYARKIIPDVPLLFAHSWIVPNARCIKGCHIRPIFKQIHSAKHPKKDCLPTVRIPVCKRSCRALKLKKVHAPVICVRKDMLEKLRNHLEHGTPVQLTAATSVETAAEVTIPLLCKCKCAGKKTSESENKQSIESQVEKTKDEKQRAKSQRTK